MDSSEKPTGYEPVAVTAIPRDAEGNCKVNLYVYLPTPKKFILFVPSGEKFTLARKTSLEKHSVPALFVKTSEVEQHANGVVEAPLDPNGSILDYEIMGQGGNKTLKQIFKALSASEGEAPQEAILELEKTANDIVSIVAPDVEDLKARILENAQHVWVMNDASAIITLAVLFSAANGFDSQKSLRDIVYASLVMDLPLIALGEDTIEQAYKDISGMSKDLRDKYQMHPIESYRLAKQSLRYFTETAMQLILNHHEYKNGSGWPRKIRTETLFPLAKVFSAAVDAFESLKRAQFNGETKTLQDVIVSLFELGEEPHMRKHNREILDKVVEFMGIPASLVLESSVKKAA